MRAGTFKSLERKGFWGDPDLETCLELLARPEWEVDGRLHLSTDGPRTSVLLGSDGTRAAVGVLDADHLTLWRTSATGLARAAVDQLPGHPTGTGASITLPAATLDVCAARAGSDPDALLRALVAAGLGKDEARKIVEVTGQVVRFGHFGAAHTPRHGVRERAGHVVSFYDNPLGRYLFSRRPSNDALWVTLSPGSAAAITRQIEELLRDLAR